MLASTDGTAGGSVGQTGDMTQPPEPQRPVPPAAGQSATPSFTTEPSDPAQRDRGANRRVLGLVVGGVVIVVVVVAAILLLNIKLSWNVGKADAEGTTFTVDGCARPHEPEATPIDCSEAKSGDYVVTAEVDDSAECSDQTQPVIMKDDAVYCLKPFTG